MNETASELFLLVSVLVMVSTAFIFTSMFAPEKPSNPGNFNESSIGVNSSQDNSSVMLNSSGSNPNSSMTGGNSSEGLLVQSIKGIRQLFRDVGSGMTLIQSGQGS